MINAGCSFLVTMEVLTLSTSRRGGIGSRLIAHWRLKLLGVPVFIMVFFAAYFLLLRFPAFGVTTMPLTAFDAAIPYQPASLVIYFSLWFYVSLAPAMLQDREELLFHGKAAGCMSFVGLGIFFLWPTTVPLDASLRGVDAAGLAWLKQVDSAGNACPSLHVAFAVFSGLWLDRVLVEMRLPAMVRWLNLAWCLAIAYSTLSTKQHVLVDVIAGAALGAIAGFIGYGKAMRKHRLIRL